MIRWVPGCVSLAFPEVLYTVFNHGIQQKNIFQSSVGNTVGLSTTRSQNGAFKYGSVVECEALFKF